METLESSCSSATEDSESYVSRETWCLKRVGKDSEWLHLVDNTEVTLGRGLNVTYQLQSEKSPLMISRLHCLFKQREHGEWTVTDMKSLNGVFVNGQQIPAKQAHQLKQGDLITVGVAAITGAKAEFEYKLIRWPLEDLRPHLTKTRPSEGACVDSRSKKTKRKLENSDELEPSTSSKSKLSRHDCPERLGDEAGPSGRRESSQSLQRGPDGADSDLSSRYSQNMLVLRKRLDDEQRQMVVREARQQVDPVRERQIKDLHAQIHYLEKLERSVSETEKQLEVQKTQQQEELLKKQLEEALQAQNKIIAEFALSRQGFEEVLLAKDKELEVTKEEKERARAQKEEVVTQMTEVMENELQCIICSELFIEAVTLNCAHSFCQHCIKEWRKRKNECPMCRQAIQVQTRSLVLDNCIDRMVENLSPEMKDRREKLITERKVPAAKPEAVMVIDSDSDSSSASIASSNYSNNSSIVLPMHLHRYRSDSWSSHYSSTDDDF